MYDTDTKNGVPRPFPNGGAWTFSITTLGCRVNQCESDAIARTLQNAGWEKVDAGRAADLCILNTCTVTHRASMQSRQVARQAVRANPEARLLVTGCYAQTEPDALAAIDGIDWIVGHGEKDRIPEIVAAAFDTAGGGPTETPSILRTDIRETTRFGVFEAAAFGERTRPVLKVQDGCNAFCTYCIVPYARGRSRSLEPSEVLERVNKLAANGFREVVLSGIHLGEYGGDLTPSINLHRLLEEILAKTAIDRLRLSSIEPKELTDEILELAASTERICNHFHIPLQSGDDGVLRKMGRPYDAAFFASLVCRLHGLMPDAAIGVDTLIGFPGESDAAFRRTHDLIRDLPVGYLHVFPFSPRPGTPAATFPDPVSTAVIKERCRTMRRMGREKRAAFYRRFVGGRVSVLVEHRREKDTGLLKGVSGNYLNLKFEGGEEAKNRLRAVRVEKIVGDGHAIGAMGVLL